MNDHNLRIIPLGGLGEVGKNMLAVEYGENILVIDAGLMLFLASVIVISLSGVIVPGRPDDSEVMARLITDDADLKMPPADSNIFRVSALIE